MDIAGVKNEFVQSDHYSSRNGAPILAVVIHATAGKDSRNHLKRNADGVSTHILIDKAGTAIRMVWDEWAAHHCGYSKIVMNGKTYDRRSSISPNQISLGVELENLNNGKDPYTEPQFLTLGAVLNYWEDRHNKPTQFFHRDIDTQGKTDPVGISWAMIREWMQRARGTDPYDVWRNAGHEPNKTFAIERYWLVNQQLGAPRSKEIYINDSISVRGFENGAVFYNKRTNVVKEIR